MNENPAFALRQHFLKVLATTAAAWGLDAAAGSVGRRRIKVACGDQAASAASA